VNVGDVLEAMSAGRWRSTWHRVPVPPPARSESTQARTTIAFFQYPNAEAHVANLRRHDGLEVAAGEYLGAKVRALIGANFRQDLPAEGVGG
jgi:isopenicillin N synthase-like dioxygenase